PRASCTPTIAPGCAPSERTTSERNTHGCPRAMRAAPLGLTTTEPSIMGHYGRNDRTVRGFEKTKPRGNAPGAASLNARRSRYSGTTVYVTVCATGSFEPVNGMIATDFPITRSVGTREFALSTYVTLLPSDRWIVRLLPAT